MSPVRGVSQKEFYHVQKTTQDSNNYVFQSMKEGKLMHSDFGIFLSDFNISHHITQASVAFTMNLEAWF